jgi:hypothetical protein
MNIPGSAWVHISRAVVIVVAASFLIRLHDAGGFFQ